MILKLINYKHSNSKDMVDAINYCNNTEKSKGIQFQTSAICSDPVKAFSLNKFLNNKTNVKRKFKSFVISMDTQWPANKEKYSKYCEKMYELMTYSNSWWADAGFQVTSAVHCNTEHPHIHTVIDTCNIKTGMQLSQDFKMLNNFKDFLNKSSINCGFNEIILSKISIDEDQLYAEDDLCFEIQFDDEKTELYDDRKSSQTQGKSVILDTQQFSETAKREMVKIIDNTLPYYKNISQKQGRVKPGCQKPLVEMVKIINKDTINNNTQYQPVSDSNDNGTVFYRLGWIQDEHGMMHPTIIPVKE